MSQKLSRIASTAYSVALRHPLKLGKRGGGEEREESKTEEAFHKQMKMANKERKKREAAEAKRQIGKWRAEREVG